MALFFYEQWTCSLKKNVMVLALGNGLKEEVEARFFFFEWIIKLSVLRKVWLKKIKENKRIWGSSWQWQCQGGSVTEKSYGLSWRRLAASASGCLSLCCQRWGGLTPGPCPPLALQGCWTRGIARGHTRDSMDSLDWDSTGTVLPGFHDFADCSDRK